MNALHRPTRLLPLIAAVAVLGLGTAGCGDAETTGVTSSGTSSTGPSDRLSDRPDEPSASAEPEGGVSPGSGGTGGAPGGAVVPAATRCTLAELTPTRGRTTGEAGQRHTVIVWTNTSARTCTMTGFGGIDLHGPPDPTWGPTYSLPRAGRTPAAVRLPPRAAAHTTITWLPPQDGPGWTPTTLLVTPPDETRSASLPWPGGAVLRQDGATHPGTYFDPVAPGAEG